MHSAEDRCRKTRRSRGEEAGVPRPELPLPALGMGKRPPPGRAGRFPEDRRKTPLTEGVQIRQKLHETVQRFPKKFFVCHFPARGAAREVFKRWKFFHSLISRRNFPLPVCYHGRQEERRRGRQGRDEPWKRGSSGRRRGGGICRFWGRGFSWRRRCARPGSAAGRPPSPWAAWRRRARERAASRRCWAAAWDWPSFWISPPASSSWAPPS